MPQRPGKADAQHRTDRIRAFQEELAELERAGVIELSAEQRAALEVHHTATLAALAEQFDVDTSEAQKHVSWGMRIASTLGGLALCAAVVLFFHRIWGHLPTAAQAGALLATPLLLLAATEFAARRERTLYYASLLSAVAFAAFVLNVSVLASIFNLTPGPHAFLAWGLFALLLAYHYRLLLPLVAGLVCLFAYSGALLSAWFGGHWTNTFSHPEHLLAGGVLLVAAPRSPRQAAYPEFTWVYHGLGLAAIFGVMLALSEAGVYSYLPLPRKAVEVCYQVAGFALAGACVWLGAQRRLATVTYVGAWFFCLFLLLRFIDWWWDWMPGYLFFLILGFIAIGLLVAFKQVRARLAGEAP
jgi:hypothetical protein